MADQTNSVAAAPFPAEIASAGHGLTFSEIGNSGLRQFGGWVREEFLPQLTGLQGARVYREMADNSPTIGAILFAITQAMRKVEWRVQPASDKPEAQEAADFIESCKSDMSHTWADFVAEALSMLTYGFAPHELVYKRRLGKQKQGSGLASSKFTDGRIGWRRLPLRGQDTVIRWYFDENGTIQGLQQQPFNAGMISLPIEKLLLFRPGIHKNNPEGRSILRTSYRPYYFIKRLEEIGAVMIERFSGLPVVYVPSNLLTMAAKGDPQSVATLNVYKNIATSTRVNEQMGVVLPSDTYAGPNGPSNIRQYEFKFEAPPSHTGTDGEKPIERYKLEIMTTVLADFLQLGHSSRGTQGLSINKVDMFYGAVEGWLNGIAEVFNRYAIPRLWEANRMDPALMPELIPDLATRTDLDSLGSFVLNLANAGMPLFPDEDLETFLRDAAGLPDLQDERAMGATNDGTDAEALKRIIKASAARRMAQGRGLAV